MEGRMMQEAIRFYCGLNEREWNHHPPKTGSHACIAPVSGKKDKRENTVSVPTGTLVIQDSGAFCDASIKLRGDAYTKQGRLSFADALKRQEAHAEKYGYSCQIEARASYDLLIDETWSLDPLTGQLDRKKQRWQEGDADGAVDETVAAARFLSQHRNGLACVLSAQGVTAKQYLHCAERIMPFFRDGDIFGCGGWCILGKQPSLLTAFRETMQHLIPFLAREGVKRVHIWGCIYAPGIGELLYLCDQYGVQLSADTAHPTYAPAMGSWGYGSWRATKTYQRPPVLESCLTFNEQGKKANCEPGTYCRGLERIRHVAETRDWLEHFREREAQWYRFIPIVKPELRQASWLEEGIA